MRRAIGIAAGLASTLVLALAQPALGAMTRAAGTQSTTFAGFDFANYIGVPGAVSAVIVVPKLICAGTPSAGSSVYAGVGIQSVNSYARLYLACTAQGAARYYPSLVVDGTVKNVTADVVQPGDTIEFAVSQSASLVTDSVIDVTHKFDATSNGSGSGTGEGILAGDFPGTTSALPNFGTLTFSEALINGYPFGATGSGLQADDLYASSPSLLEVRTTFSTSDREAFATVFEHS